MNAWIIIKFVQGLNFSIKMDFSKFMCYNVFKDNTTRAWNLNSAIIFHGDFNKPSNQFFYWNPFKSYLFLTLHSSFPSVSTKNRKRIFEYFKMYASPRRWNKGENKISVIHFIAYEVSLFKLNNNALRASQENCRKFKLSFSLRGIFIYDMASLYKKERKAHHFMTFVSLFYVNDPSEFNLSKVQIEIKIVHDEINLKHW